MPVKRNIPYDSGHFFITFTCFNWLQLIDITNSHDLVYNWFEYLKQHGHFITGYVIMPNHVHATIAFGKTKKRIKTIVGDGKRFIGYEIVKRLKKQGKNDLLLQLESAVNNSDKKKGNLHEAREGDLLVFYNAGAYGFEMSSNFNSRLKPAEVMLINGKAKLIRKRDVFEDLLRNQLVD